MGLAKHAESDQSIYYTTVFDCDGIHYSCRLTPKPGTGERSASWHIVLNDVFFGFMHKNGGHWEVSEQRPAILTQQLGEIIDKKLYEMHTI